MSINNTQNSIVRRVAEADTTDVFRGIARISSNDAALLSIGFADLIRIESKTQNAARSRSIAFAKTFFMNPSDENRLGGSDVQIDSVTRMSLDVNLGDNVTISKAGTPVNATSITLEPFDELLSLENTTFNRNWVLHFVEDRPLWKGAMIGVPAEKPVRLQVVSIEPGNNEVTMGTTKTKIIMPERSDQITRMGQLFAFNLVITFKRRAFDYDTLAAGLAKRGFEKKEIRMVSGGFLASAGQVIPDPNLLRQPGFPSHGLDHVPPPNLKRGRIQILGIEHESSGRVINIGHGYDDNPWEKPEELLRDMEEGIPLVRETLESDLKLNLNDDIKEIRFDCMYKVPGKKDARWVVENAEDVPGFDQLLAGHRTQGRIKLYPTMIPTSHGAKRSLTPLGLIEIGVHPMGSDSYTVQFDYGLSDIEGFSNYARTNATRSAAIVTALEESAPDESD